MQPTIRGKKKKLLGKKEIKERYDNDISECTSRYQSLRPESLVKFSDLPLSSRTLAGLESAGFVNLTDIQRLSIPHCLRGSDIQAEAITGSGKTLGFLVPVLELLWREKWAPSSGIGALIITPTRELAYQIFEVLKKVGSRHDFSAGLIIGGKSVEEERVKILKTNVVIATPGRLLQHMDQTAGFSCDLLQVLVLDEADRILDLGFSRAMKFILDNLPSERQTLLFSATLSNPKIVKLANLSLKDSQVVSANSKTPALLTHSYVEVELSEKLEVLYAFIKSHLNSKILVFMSSCKQVQFHNAVLCKLRPGLPILALYGKQKQLRRVGIYEAFCRKTAAVLLATDIAARGLDIPAVHWVVHLDCPEDVETYIHRSGRTARYHKTGNSLAMLQPSELAMADKLAKNGVVLTKIRVNPQKQVSIQKKVQSLCAESPEIHHWARKCFVSYVRSVFLQGDKSVFDVEALPLAAYAASLGLLTAPKVRFMKKAEKKRGEVESDSGNQKDSGIAKEDNKEEECAEADAKLCQVDTGLQSSDDEDILVKKNSDVMKGISTENLEEIGPRQPKKKAKTKVAKAKALLRKGIKANTKILFDEEGNVDSQEGVFDNADVTNQPDITPATLPSLAGGINISEMEENMGIQDKEDKSEERMRRKEAKRIRKEKKKRKMNEDGDADGSGSVTIATLPDSGSEDESRDDITRDNITREDITPDNIARDSATRDTFEHLYEMPAKKFKHSDKLQNTEELARQLLGDL